MADGKTPAEHIYKDETYDFMFAEIVKHEKYQHLLNYMPITKQPVSFDGTAGKGPSPPKPSIPTSTVDEKPSVFTGTPSTVHSVTSGTLTSPTPVTTGIHSPIPPVSVLLTGTMPTATTDTPKLVPPLYTSTPTGIPPEFEGYLKGLVKPPLGSDVKYKASVLPPPKPPPKEASKKDEKSPVHESFTKGLEKPSVIPGVEYSLDFETPKFLSPTKRKPQKQAIAPPMTGASGLSDASLIDLAKVPIPKLPQFSGTDAKGEASYEVWKFEVVCLQKEKIYPDAHILQAIRRSLKGQARDILMTVGDNASSEDVLTKLNGIYGIVSSNESILQQFYLEQQRESENVAHYSIRLENMLQQTKDYVPEKTKNEMLRSKLWSGLRDSQLKNASRFKYELETDFNKLRIAIRQIEQDMPTETVQTASLQQQTVGKNSDSALEEILKRLKLMEGKMEGMEKTIEKKIENKLREKSEGNNTSNQEESERGGKSRGYYNSYNRGRGNFRGRYRGGRRGNRGSLNESGSTSQGRW